MCTIHSFPRPRPPRIANHRPQERRHAGTVEPHSHIMAAAAGENWCGLAGSRQPVTRDATHMGPHGRAQGSIGAGKGGGGGEGGQGLGSGGAGVSTAQVTARTALTDAGSFPSFRVLVWAHAPAVETDVHQSTHTIISGAPGDTDAGSMFNTSDMTDGMTFSHVFETASNHSYHCECHPYMMATITVEGGDASGDEDGRVSGDPDPVTHTISWGVSVTCHARKQHPHDCRVVSRALFTSLSCLGSAMILEASMPVLL